MALGKAHTCTASSPFLITNILQCLHPAHIIFTFISTHHNYYPDYHIMFNTCHIHIYISTSVLCSYHIILILASPKFPPCFTHHIHIYLYMFISIYILYISHFPLFLLQLQYYHMLYTNHIHIYVSKFPPVPTFCSYHIHTRPLPHTQLHQYLHSTYSYHIYSNLLLLLRY